MRPDELLDALVRELVDKPELVAIDSYISDDSATFDIYVAYSDVGKVLGRGGEYAQALRILFTAIYGKHKMRLNRLQVVDPRSR